MNYRSCNPGTGTDTRILTQRRHSNGQFGELVRPESCDFVAPPQPWSAEDTEQAWSMAGVVGRVIDLDEATHRRSVAAAVALPLHSDCDDCSLEVVVEPDGTRIHIDCDGEPVDCRG